MQRYIGIFTPSQTKGKKMEQKLFRAGDMYFLVESYPSGVVTLKVKENGWGDIWSLPLQKVDSSGNALN
jgi:hypothetical protein